MAADGTLLQGEVSENPGISSDALVIQRMLQGLLGSLLDEQRNDQRKEALSTPSHSEPAKDKDVR
jgi:hypothetical protein